MALRPTYRAYRTAKKVMSVDDGSIIEDESQIEHYRKTRDLKHLKLNPDEDPTWFHLQAISHEDFTRVCAETGVNALAIWQEVFRIGCLNIDNLFMEIVESDGEVKQIQIQCTREEKAGGHKRVTDAVVRAVGKDVVKEMADIIMEMSRLGDREKKASSPPISQKNSKSNGSSTATDALSTPTSESALAAENPLPESESQTPPDGPNASSTAS